MADKKISELGTASVINNGDNIELSQDTGNGLVSLKATILALATKMLTAINFTSALTTTDKTVIGAINEVAQGGGGGGTDVIADDFDSTSTYAVGDYCIYEGSLYKCTTAVTTAGDWDSSDWTETLVMDEVEQGGGGGGAGHTIIDENGNSMTARAGLQFVGGANVSDDSTNNKTIVDLASAGGIDGVFIDINNLIKDDFILNGESNTWTATEDCILTGILIAMASNSSANISVGNDIYVFVTYQSSKGEGLYLPVKKGQTITYKAKTGSKMEAYGIQTGTTHSKFQPVIYSTEEREIGVWTDGKPLYQKTVQLASNMTVSSTWNDMTFSSPISNVETVVQAIMNSGTPFGFSSSYMRFRANDGKIQVQTKDGGTVTFNATWVFTLQYTKTTDTAGSGTWTPSGIPSVHYSTEEQVIGTWIDGSTLYEKTITIASLPSDTEEVEYIVSSETINLIGYEGYVIFSSGNKASLPYTTVSPTVTSVDDIKRAMINTQINGNGKFWVRCGQDRSNCSAVVTVKYTKSS